MASAITCDCLDTKLSKGESVQRISEDLGYESVSAFITFSKIIGKPPAQYMKDFVETTEQDEEGDNQ